MPGFTTNEDGSWSFKLDDTPKDIELPDISPSDPNTVEVPKYLSGKEKWSNYTDLILYELEVLLRKFFERKKEDPRWARRDPFARRMTLGMVYQELYGVKIAPSDKLAMKRSRRLTNLLAYYSTRVQKEGSVQGRKTNKKIYTLSLKRYDKLPPYSLRLRMEWLAEQGRLPVWQNMKLPKDDLKAGHARSKKTEANMERRREDARKRYNEKYKDRSH